LSTDKNYRLELRKSLRRNLVTIDLAQFCFKQIKRIAFIAVLFFALAHRDKSQDGLTGKDFCSSAGRTFFTRTVPKMHPPQQHHDTGLEDNNRLRMESQISR
jgi:hypothetical protein